eukprot:2234537-Prorocentrum_lima.AAC.1
MTSSLVGSEMCIRDSDDAVLWSCHAVPCIAVPCLVLVIVIVVLLVPVSYTHLTLPTICSV